MAKDKAKVEPGVSGEQYSNLWCEKLQTMRASLYCRNFCANTDWCDQKRNDTRSKCPSYKLYLQTRSA